MFKTFYSSSDWRMVCSYSNIGCSESKVIFKWRKNNNNNKNKKKPLQGANVHTSCISFSLSQNFNRTRQTNADDKGCAEACTERFSALNVLRHFENRKAGIPFSSPEPVVSWLQIKPSGSGDENAGIQETEARALVRMSYGFCALSRAILFQRFFRNWDRSRTSTPCAFHLPRKWQQIQIYCVWQDRKLVQLSQNRLWVACLLLPVVRGR